MAAMVTDSFELCGEAAAMQPGYLRWGPSSGDATGISSPSFTPGKANTSSLQKAAPITPPHSAASSIDGPSISFAEWDESHEKIVTGPYDYVAALPGKELRSLLLACFNEWLEVPPDSLATIDRTIRMLHTSSLLIDDIQDNSDLRRGQPTSHKIYGEALTINSANYVYFLALQELSALKSQDAVGIFTSEMLALHRGQAMDLYWRDTLTCPAEEEYYAMVSNKTGGLFRLAYKLMKAESKTPVELLSIVEVLGVLFQVADDYKNLCNQDYGALKGIGEDLTEGKFSFPIIHGIKADPLDKRLLHILQQRPTEESVKLYAVKLMEESGSLQYTRDVIKRLVEEVRTGIELLDQGRGRGKSMLKLVNRIADSVY